MSLNNASIFADATITSSAGTALPFGSLGSVAGSNTLYALDDADIRTRRDIICTTVQPRTKADAPNGYTQARSTAFIKVPLSLDNGGLTVNTIRIELATDVETTDAEKATLRGLAVQALIDGDFQEFWDNQSIV